MKLLHIILVNTNLHLKLQLRFLALFVPSELHDTPEAGLNSTGDGGYLCESRGGSTLIEKNSNSKAFVLRFPFRYHYQIHVTHH